MCAAPHTYQSMSSRNSSTQVCTAQIQTRWCPKKTQSVRGRVCEAGQLAPTTTRLNPIVRCSQGSRCTHDACTPRLRRSYCLHHAQRNTTPLPTFSSCLSPFLALRSKRDGTPAICIPKQCKQHNAVQAQREHGTAPLRRATITPCMHGTDEVRTSCVGTAPCHEQPSCPGAAIDPQQPASSDNTCTKAA
jgi:hypothetical protein